jgi:hypothetical protein
MGQVKLTREDFKDLHEEWVPGKVPKGSKKLPPGVSENLDLFSIFSNKKFCAKHPVLSACMVWEGGGGRGGGASDSVVL